jgi:protein-tyrosine-phosphatase
MRTISRKAAKAILRRLLGQQLFERILAWRALGPRASRVFLKLRLSRSVRSREKSLQQVLSRAKSILFVCYGNIIRSPMAAALTAQELDRHGEHSIRIESAAMRKNVEARADNRAIEASHEFGIALESHKPKTVTRELVENSDAIFVMDYIVEAMLVSEYPFAQKKTFLLGEVRSDTSAASREVKDPYTGGIEDIRDCYRELFQLTQLLADRLTTRAGQAISSKH